MTRSAIVVHGLALLLAASTASARPEPTTSQPEVAEHEAAAEHAGGGHHGPGPIELFEGSETIIPFGAMLVNFALLVSALILFGKKPITAMLAARHQAIKDGLEEAQSLRRRAEERYREFGARLEAFQTEIDQLVAEYRKAGEAERARIVAEAQEKAARMRREAEFLVSQEGKQVKIDLHREAAENAVRAAEERLREAVTPADQERLAREYLTSMGGQKQVRA